MANKNKAKILHDTLGPTMDDMKALGNIAGLKTDYTVENYMPNRDMSGREYRRTLECMPPDMSDEQWDVYARTGVEPEESTLDYMVRNVNPDDPNSIASLQYTLKRHGLYKDGEIDGVMGKKTVRAMRRHQALSKKTSILDNIMDFLKDIY